LLPTGRFFWAWLFLCVLAAAQNRPDPSKAAASFTLTGTVVNSVTGEPIPRALVRLNGAMERVVFSDAQGGFEFVGLPAGSADINAQKPGYFDPRQQEDAIRRTPIAIGSGKNSLTIKLAPLGAIYGRITDTTGQSLEYVPIRLSASVVRDGRRRRWEPRATVRTDEDGRFRLANLMPGTYYLVAGPGRQERRLLARGEKPKTGYGISYYPGVLDIASASPIELVAGQQVQADLSLNVGPLFQVSGTVSGGDRDSGFSVQVLSPTGDALPVPLGLNPEMGTFHIDALPAGSYVLKAAEQSGRQRLVAEAPLSVSSSVSSLRLALAPALSIPVLVRIDPRANAASPQRNLPRLTIRLSALGPPAADSYSTLSRGNAGNYSMELQSVEPGKYQAVLLPQGPWYVYSATYGETNLLSEDMTVTAGRATPIEVVLRDDSATLTGTVKGADGRESRATVVALPQPANRAAVKTSMTMPGSGVNLEGLAPGDYLIFAFDRVDGLEYANAEALEPYASQAVPVTLVGGQKTQVALTMIQRGSEP